MALIEVIDEDYLNEIIFNYKVESKKIILLQKAELYSNKFECEISKIKAKDNEIVIKINSKGQLYPGTYKLFLLFEQENIFLKIGSYKNHGKNVNIQIPPSYFLSINIPIEYKSKDIQVHILNFEKIQFIDIKNNIISLEFIDQEDLIQHMGMIIKDIRILRENMEIILNGRVEKIQHIKGINHKRIALSIVKISKSDMERLITMGTR
jgi:hypothetical protein